jgi:uncharacterized repeat protein (TIGR01451 family)
MKRHMLAALGLLSFGVIAHAQPLHAPGPVHPLPATGPAPLLHARFTGPQGMHVTFHQGRAAGVDFAAPTAVGLRPGYVYRVRVHGMAAFPDLVLYPTLEVRGSLELPPGILAANYPAPIHLTESDIRCVLSGSLITKVIYLENPERAVPLSTKPGELLEADSPANRDPLEDARSRGRPIAILRLGERTFTPEEMAACSVPGTILLPGAKSLGRPAAPPHLRAACFRVCDPIIGCRPPEEECLHDGGDVGVPVGIRPDGKLGGLDVTDTVAEYTDSKGRRSVAKSNRVCICVPRFAALRQETPVAGYVAAMNPATAAAVHGRAMLRSQLPSIQTAQVDILAGIHGRERPSGIETKAGVLEVNNLTTLVVIGQIDGIHVVGAVCEKPMQQPDKPLCLQKWTSACSAQVGDVITFTLRYSNCGGQPITNIAVNDSLSGRLEYVPGSAKSDRDAVFTTQPNEAGSVIVRWEVSGKLQPGESGFVTFQAKVR